MTEALTEPIGGGTPERHAPSSPDVLPSASAVERVAADLDTYRRVEELTAAAYAARRETTVAEARLRQIDTAVERTHRTADAFDARLAEMYYDPGRARDAFMRVADAEGIDVAALTLREKPERLADLRDPERRAGVHPDVVRAHARDTANAAAIEGQLAYEAQEAVRDTAEAVHARRLDAVFRRAVATLYEDPVGARARFMDHAADYGVQDAAERLKTSPESFGPLRPDRPREQRDTPLLDATTRTRANLAADAGKAWAEYELPVDSGATYVPAVQEAHNRAERAQVRFERALAEVYREPRQVRHVLFSIAGDHGLHQAAELLRTGTYRFGLTHSTRVNTALGSQLLPITIDPARLEIIIARGRADYRAQQELMLAQSVHQQRGLGHAFRAALHDAYERVSDAWRRFADTVKARGVEDAARLMRESPEWYGRLRPVTAFHESTLGPANSAEATRAAAELGRRYYATPSAVGPVREAAWQDVVRTRASESKIRRALASLPSQAMLQRSIGVAVHHMAPAELVQLKNMVTEPHMALARQLAARVRELVLGSERER